MDRLKGIISLFHFSIVTDKRFYINCTFPFDLNKYLIPNEYNWEIILDRYPIYQFRTLYLICEMDGERLFSYKGKRSLLIYSNFNLISQLNACYKTDFSFGELFKILFKPSEMVKGKIEYVKNYIAIVGNKNDQEKAGYYGEKIVLKCPELGLNTCWVAMTYGKSKAEIKRGQKLLIIISLGYGKTQGVPHKSKSIAELGKAD